MTDVCEMTQYHAEIKCILFNLQQNGINTTLTYYIPTKMILIADTSAIFTPLLAQFWCPPQTAFKCSTRSTNYLQICLQFDVGQVVYSGFIQKTYAYSGLARGETEPKQYSCGQQNQNVLKNTEDRQQQHTTCKLCDWIFNYSNCWKIPAIHSITNWYKILHTRHKVAEIH